MKIFLKRIVILSILMTLVFDTKVVLASSNTVEKSVVSGNDLALYETGWADSNGNISYPITSEDVDLWKQMKTRDEMVEACNMPDDLEKSLSTDELIKLILNYPLLGDLLLFDDLETALSKTTKESNILKELLCRPDGASKLLVAYCNIDIDEKAALSESEINSINSKFINELSIKAETREEIMNDYEIISSVIFLETLLVQDDIMDDLSDKELSILAVEASEKVTEKMDSNLFSAYKYTIYEVAEKNGNIENLGNVDKTSVKTQGVVGSDYYTTVKTPKGSKVNVVQRTYNASEAFAALAYVKRSYPNAKIVSDATTNYNCHSYAWYSQSTSNKYWMNDPAKYISDGSYKKVGTKPTAANQKVCYIDMSNMSYPRQHSGIVYSISGTTIKIKSKWGSGPLVIHNVTYSPYSGTPTYFR